MRRDLNGFLVSAQFFKTKMIRLKTLRDLKKQQPVTEIVYVKSVNKMFRCHDGEWIERAYYTLDEVSNILNVPRRSALYIMKKIGIRPRAVKHEDLVSLIKIHQAKQESKSTPYSEIRRKLKL